MHRPEIIVGVGGVLGHDSNAAVLVDGRVAAASQEERYSRQKHDGAFPEQALRDCLAIAGCAVADVDVCVFADKPMQELLATHTDRPSNWLTWQMGRLTPERSFPFLSDARRVMPHAKFQFAWHHLCHAALAFATSPFERAAFLCVDGRGDDVNATIGVADGRRTEIQFELAYEHGLGMFYSLITDFLGFAWNSEYKVMGLAPFGTPVFVDTLREFVRTDANGALRFNQPRTSWTKLCKRLTDQLGMAPRRAGEEITTAHADLAASVQRLFEEQIFRMARYAREATGEKRLLFCGGCAQNCVTAGKLQMLGIFSEVFTSPAAGDMGTGLGAALLYRQLSDRNPSGKIDVHHMHLGSSPGEIPREGARFRVAHGGDIVEATARLLADGAIVGWVQGRMEYGARALGARSILADPRDPDMQARINLETKGRESFRPFAPAILADDVDKWFDTTDRSDYMQRVAWMKPEHRYATPDKFPDWRERLSYARCAVPAVIHVDYSARLQTVDHRHAAFHRLLTQFKRLTGVPMLINTSFNLAGEPIVRTAADAWRCFARTRMDYLVIDDVLLRHPDSKVTDHRAW